VQPLFSIKQCRHSGLCKHPAGRARYTEPDLAQSPASSVIDTVGHRNECQLYCLTPQAATCLFSFLRDYKAARPSTAHAGPSKSQIISEGCWQGARRSCRPHPFGLPSPGPHFIGVSPRCIIAASRVVVPYVSLSSRPLWGHRSRPHHRLMMVSDGFGCGHQFFFSGSLFKTTHTATREQEHSRKLDMGSRRQTRGIFWMLQVIALVEAQEVD
jgi:hypothetical protein